MSTQKVLAFFGDGSGLANSTAKRFAREGYKIALVARNQAYLEQRVVADVLADKLWHLTTARDGVESVIPPFREQ